MGAEECPYTLGSEEVAQETMERFWVKWAEDLGDGPVESRLEVKQDRWENVWRNTKFWYGMSPEQMLAMLERLQAEAWEIDWECSDERLKKHFIKLILPLKPGFNNSRPKWVEVLVATKGAKLNGTILRKWYDEFQLDSSKPLNDKCNKDFLTGENMDPDGPSMKNQSGVMGPVPSWRRTVELGFPPGSSSRRMKKRSSSDSVERNGGLESAATDNSAQLAAMQLELIKLREQANRGTERQGKPQGKNAPIDLIKEPWRGAVSQAQYAKHWRVYPGDNLCPFYAVYCNLPAALAQQKKLNKSVCNCIGGYVLATGQQKNEDYTAQATPQERRKVYSDLKAMDQAKEKACEGLADYDALREIRVVYSEKRRQYKLAVIKRWQSQKQAGGGKKLASSAVQRQEEHEEDTDEEEPSGIEEVEDEEDLLVSSSEEEDERKLTEIDSVDQ
jgi:hypothetical protein